MTESAAQLVALRHYRTKWFGQAWAAISAAWQTEYDSVAAGTFTSILILSNSGDGWTANAQKNFEQSVRLAALQNFRADQDADYAAAVFGTGSNNSPDGPSVMLPIFSRGAFPH